VSLSAPRGERRAGRGSRGQVKVIRQILVAAGLATLSVGLADVGAVRAQEIAIDRSLPVSLVADSMEYDSETGIVTASGNVEVFYGNRTLTADRISYNSRTERIEAEGNLILRDETGATVYASVAELDANLRDGLVRGAQSVIGNETTGKLAAVEGRRVEERYNALSKAVYSPCDVCQEDPTPLWRIRARRVIHDEEERVVHYENAYFDLFGVPVAWLPYFSHPDPTVKRATGFLTPGFRRSGNYGFGVSTPFYWAIDPSSDMTFRPLFTTEAGQIMEGEYRRAFETGRMRLGGSLGWSDFTGDSQLEGHLDTDGQFSLSSLDAGARWGWDIRFASDDDYLRYFDFSSADRLTSEVYLRNYWEDGFYDLSGLYFQSLRNKEPAGPIPRVLPEFRARKEFAAPYLGGEVGLFADTESLFRNVGRDVTRLSLGVDWEEETILPFGLAIKGFAEMRGDVFLTFEDQGSAADETTFRFAPLAGVEARYPLIWTMESGSSHVIEPIAQFIVAPYGGNDVPNEDSQQTEFDETNLFDRSHFSGIDGFEEGPRVNLGLRYEHFTTYGLGLDASAGRVLRFAEADEFDPGSGLNGIRSDWVGAWGASYLGYLSIRQRMRVDDDFHVSRNEIYARASYGPASAGVGYVFLESSPLSGTLDDREEVTAFGGVQLTPEWGVSGFLQRDLQEKEFVEVGGQLSYANECCSIDLFVRRRFTESRNSPASTSVGVEVELLTLGNTVEKRGLFDRSAFSAPQLVRGSGAGSAGAGAGVDLGLPGSAR